MYYFNNRKADKMLKVNKLSYWYLQRDLYDEISFEIEDGQHAALIGVNGSGKSSLIDLIMNSNERTYNGTIEIKEDSIIGYVSQFSSVPDMSQLTVSEYIGGDYIELQNRLNKICLEMETSDDIENLLEDFQEVSDKMEALGGHDFEMTVSKKLRLADLGKHKNLALSELSGGEFKLVQIIKEMLNSPDLLIMDEPDVFLDFENLNSLRNLINSYKGTMLVVTHNRYLLNHCFNKILHLEDKQLQEFDGNFINYNFYLLQTKIELQELSLLDEEEIERNEAIMEKFQFAANLNADAAIGKYVNARAKIIERLEANKVKAPFVYIKQPSLSLPSVDALEDETILKVENLNISFDEDILEDVNFEIQANEKIAIVGSNGSGKTTLLRKIFENDADQIKVNESVNLGYLSQLQGEMLKETNTVLDEFFEMGFSSIEKVNDYMTNLNFHEEMGLKKISKLSGGEKNLLQICKIEHTNSNLLLLDEPTSHLDMYSQLALEKAVEEYKGAILMVSHDFYFIINTMDSILLLEDKKVRKMNIKKFKRMVYENHFDKNYIELEDSKKSLEVKIESALQNQDFTTAQNLSLELEELIKSF